MTDRIHWLADDSLSLLFGGGLAGALEPAAADIFFDPMYGARHLNTTKNVQGVQRKELIPDFLFLW